MNSLRIHPGWFHPLPAREPEPNEGERKQVMVRILPQYSRKFEPLAREMWANAQLITTHDRDTPAMPDFDDLSEDEQQRVLMMAEIPYRRYVVEPREQRLDGLYLLGLVMAVYAVITLVVLAAIGV